MTPLSRDRRRTLLCLTTYPAADASVRHRILGYVDELEARGWNVRVETIVGPRLFAIKNRRGAIAQLEKVARLGLGLMRRVVVIARAGSSDAVWIHREAFPFFTPIAERVLRRITRGPIILDVDDALFESAPGGGDWRSGLRRPDAFGRAARCADAIVAGSPGLAEWARSQGVPAIHAPTCVDTNAIEPRVLSARSQVTIGWIGSWSTTESLLSIAGTLRKAAEAFGVRLLFVGSFDLDRVRTAIPEAEWRTWRADRERDDLAEFDIGIMPLADTPWNRGKGAFKVIQYMAAGIPFVASPVGMNVSVARDSGAGLLCADEAAWIEALGRLALDPDLRSELGAAGRRHACMTYDHRLYAHAIADLFEMGGSGT